MKLFDKKRKSTMKIVAATMAAIFSLASAITGTFAWFSMNMSVSVTGSQFKVAVTNGVVKSISAHSFLGLNNADDSYCFNPRGQAVYKDGVAQDSSIVSLNGYDPMNPNHPIMLLFRVEGEFANIRFSTDFCYLGNDGKYCTVAATYATYAALSTAASSFTDAQNGNYYKVTTDETRDDASNVYYQYNNSALKYMKDYHEITTTYATYTAFSNASASIKVEANDGKYYRVTTDNEGLGRDQSVYKYDHSSGELQMVYLGLKSTNNPLSSAVKFNWMRFKNKDVEVTTTYATYAALTNASIQTDGNDGKYYKVLADENVGGGETIYQYKHLGGEGSKFVLAWDYLDNNGNSYAMASLDTVNVEQYSNKRYSDAVLTPNSSVMATKKNLLITDHESTFCKFDGSTPSFENEITVFKEALNGAKYVGVVIDYNSEAIEYICSAYLGHEYVSQGLGFHCDWTTII